jgi:bifunctional DNA-binding transcriptional regulator/antitoxin component of YhaV-PrlF toxin-antitoxin module
MTIARSKVTAQGRISVPAGARQKLGVGPAGSVLERDEDGHDTVVRRAGRFSSEDIHRVLFPRQAPESRTVGDPRQGIRLHIRKRHAGH